MVIAWPSTRASWSVAVPAAKGTTKRIGFSGKLAVDAPADNARRRRKERSG
jgi:hypothetical protein